MPGPPEDAVVCEGCQAMQYLLKVNPDSTLGLLKGSFPCTGREVSPRAREAGRSRKTTPAGCETGAVILWCEDFFQVIFTICCLTLMLVLIIYGPSLKAEVEAEC